MQRAVHGCFARCLLGRFAGARSLSPAAQDKLRVSPIARFALSGDALNIKRCYRANLWLMKFFNAEKITDR